MLTFKKVSAYIVFISMLLIQHSSYAQTVTINDINEKIPPTDISTLTPIIQGMLDFHKPHRDLPDVVEIPIRIFSSKKKYIAYKKMISAEAESTSGFFDTAQNELIIYKDDDYLDTILSVTQHFILGTDYNTLPKLIIKGLDEFYEKAHVEYGEAYIKDQNTKAKQLKQWLRLKQMPPLTLTLTATDNDWEELNTFPERPFSAMSWAIVYFLMNTLEGREVLSSAIKELTEYPNKELVNVLDALYLGGLNRLEEDLHEFIKDIPPEQNI